VTFRHDDRNMDVIVEGVVTKHGTETVLEASYTEPMGEKGPRLAFQGHSTITVKSVANMAICQLSDLTLHLRKHVVIKAQIKDILCCKRNGPKEFLTGQFTDNGTVCNFNIVSCLQRYSAFYPNDQVTAVVKVDNYVKQGESMPGVSVEYMTLSSQPVDLMDTATTAIANALKQMVLTGVEELKLGYRT